MPVCTISSATAAQLSELDCLLRNVFAIIIPFAGLAAFVVLIAGGFAYLTSGGDPQKTKQAQAMITGAVIGIVVTIAVWFIFLLIKEITGVDVLKFEIPS